MNDSLALSRTCVAKTLLSTVTYVFLIEIKKKKTFEKTDPYNWTNSGFILSVKCPYESNQHTEKVQNKSITVSTYPFRKKEEKWKHHWLHALFADSIHLSKLIFDIRSDLEGRHSDNSQKVENNIIPTNMNYLPAG